MLFAPLPSTTPLTWLFVWHAVFDTRTLAERLDQWLGRRRIATWLIGAFGALAMALALIGVDA